MNGTPSAMVTLTLPRVVSVTVTDDTLSVDLEDGRTIAVPIGWYPRLAHGTPAERANVQISGAGMACIGLSSMRISAWKDCCWVSRRPKVPPHLSDGCSGASPENPKRPPNQGSQRTGDSGALQVGSKVRGWWGCDPRR